jgi:hypothetical protein
MPPYAENMASVFCHPSVLIMTRITQLSFAPCENKKRLIITIFAVIAAGNTTDFWRIIILPRMAQHLPITESSTKKQ